MRSPARTSATAALRRAGSSTASRAVDNLFDRRYAGSVIVNEGNARFFEPAPGRTWTIGAGAAYRF